MARYQITISEKTYDVEVFEKRGNTLTFSVNGEKRTVTTSDAPPSDAQVRFLSSSSKNSPTQTSQQTQIFNDHFIRSPIPGIVSSTQVKAGQTLVKGTVVAVVEAMKMENNITAQQAGIVKSVLVEKGQEVKAGQELVEMVVEQEGTAL